MTIVEALDELCVAAHGNAVRKGFWDNPRNEAEQAMLKVTEIAEYVEALRCGPNDPDEHCPEFTKPEIELADVVIRIADTCGGRGYRLGGAVAAKMAYNETRPRKHGKRF